MSLIYEITGMNLQMPCRRLLDQTKNGQKESERKSASLPTDVQLAFAFGSSTVECVRRSLLPVDLVLLDELVLNAERSVTLKLRGVIYIPILK